MAARSIGFWDRVLGTIGGVAIWLAVVVGLVATGAVIVKAVTGGR